ncbi:MAG: excinuclease ABC subunit UvrA [Candidatus Eremiobacteraeota bacterium]|nr:excinuclease ABC subunit UvrA [Candidatus Eremiobacteraeota bacterium]MBV9056830.1 excinuclease ABC subunit UvrA [Candidatus Eremiobacteraeota bacterium]MBV9700429.1 excinuclease ABC subunit UvrA [Candidatus Eremiobacteraeota bacterium]
MSLDSIVIKGAREHNLKDVDLVLPRNRLIVVTGLSGSGKSSLAFDTIYAEGQRRYVESLSSYARQFLGQMEKPDVDYIEGLSPAISIDQKSTSRNPRSTVGTVTEIYDYLRLLFARVGTPHCYQCGREISSQSSEQIVDAIVALPEGTRMTLLAPLVRGRKGEYVKLFDEIAREGFSRVRIDGEITELRPTGAGGGKLSLDKKRKHRIEVVVDRLVLKPDVRKRLADSVETTLRLSSGIVTVLLDQKELTFSEAFACVDCGLSFEELAPRLFSFNSPYGACSACSGLGEKIEIDPWKVIPDRSKSIADGAIVPWSRNMGSGRYPSMNPYYLQQLERVLRRYRAKMTAPVEQFSDDVLDVILYGTDREQTFEYTSRGGKTWEYRASFEGVVNNLRRRYGETSSEYVKEEIEKFMSASTCPSCKGARLKPEALAVTVGESNIATLTRMSIEQLEAFFASLRLTERQDQIAHQIVKEIRARLGFLSNVGLSYLTLARSATTLAGGESQRIRLATQIGSALVGVLYILDEPSIGLHQRDNDRLLATLKTLRDLGNTLIVIEHDEDTMRTADVVVDIGPGAGAQGGEILTSGPLSDVIANPASETGAYLSGRKFIPIPRRRREPRGWLEVRNARANNLRGIDVRIPLGVLTSVTGVSGSGKSTLVNEVLVRALNQYLHKQPPSGTYGSVKGAAQLDKLVVIDQSPIGRTPRSNPATYTGTFDHIRELFSLVPDARMRGYTPGRFSFNVKGGRCEACQGDGIIKIEMHFLPDVYVPCEVCKGKRYNAQTLEVKYRGKTIADVLEMRVDEASEFFANIPRVAGKLRTICDVGLGYIKMGQPATTLSGGEAQRVKLATELSRRSTGRTFYVLDEPTTGLHFADIHKLLDVLQRLVKLGNSVLVIEHNLDVIKTADHLIDLGPEGGDRGGTVVATGTPEEVAANGASYTGTYLVPVLRDQRAVGHHRPDDAELERLEQENLFVLQDLAKTGRVAVEA